ncbi:MAG TPA: DUF72 domain-containing protein [Acidimicrobiales bacterium]|nr:DUF72 domain-containing protein [Acidimicrobiales bacterium]
MVKVGLCGWTISQAAYVESFRLLEVQQTFYDPPDNRVLERWRHVVPPGFEFTIKAWQLVTHEAGSPTYRRLKRPLPPEHRAEVGAFRWSEPVLEAWQRTLDCARLLRATAVLLQCPASFRPTEVNVDRLRRFLADAERPPGIRLLWEPRGEWPPTLVAELCAELGVAHVVDPMQAETVTPEQTYYRLHGTSGSRHVHSDEELSRLRDAIAGRTTPYVLFNNLPRVGDAQRFMAML